MARKDFERFYLEKVAIGEGCGCAEQAIGMRDLDRQAKRLTARNTRRGEPIGILDHIRRFLRRLRADGSR